MAAGLHSGARPVLFGAYVRDEVAVVELRYEEGAVERVRPVEGFMLHEVTAEHYTRGHRLGLAIALDPEGRFSGGSPSAPTRPASTPATSRSTKATA